MRHAILVTLALLLGSMPASAQKISVSKSLEELQLAVQRDSNDAAAHYNVGISYFGHHQYDDAERELREAVAIEPRFAEAWLALSVVHDEDRKFWKGRKKEGGDSAVRRTAEEYGRYYRRAFLVNPLMDMRILASTLTLGNEEDVSRGLRALVEGRYDEGEVRLGKAAKYYGKALGSALTDVLRWLQAMAAARAGHPDAAIAVLDTLVEHVDARKDHPDTTMFNTLNAAEMRQVIGKLLLQTGRADEAIAMFQASLEGNLGNYMAHVELANIYETRRDFERAIVERKRALETNPDESALQMELGVTLGKAGQLEAAATALQAAAAENPRDTRAFYLLGVVEEQAGHRDAAREAYRHFVAVAPSRFETQVAAARQALGRLQ